MPEIKVNNITLYYEEYGNGEPLLLLHGLTADHSMFDREIDQLKTRYRIIAPDMRGHGKSEKPVAYQLNDHVQDILSLLDHLKIDNAFILGSSMGSYVAQAIAAAQPARINKLILVVPKSHGSTSSVRELLDRHAAELGGLSYDDQLQAASKYMFYNLKAVGTYQKDALKKQPVLTPEQQSAANQALLNFDLRPVLGKITAPTLVISGTHDGLNPPERGKEIAALIPDAVYVEFDRSGHAPNVEEPERFMKTVSAFLSQP